MIQKQITNKEVKKNNRNHIFRYINKSDITSNPDISYALKMSLPTVTQNTKELIAGGLVVEMGELQSTGGRKAKALTVASNVKQAIGLDITRNHVSVVLTNLRGELLNYDRIFQPFDQSETYYCKVNDILEAFLEKNQVRRERILGIGISIPGIVDLDKKKITFSHVLNIESIPFASISRFFDFPCFFLKESNAGAYAEGIYAEEPQRFFYLSLSNTVGGAIFDQGELIQGKNYRCGEVGHMTLIPEGETCYCGKKGCLDAYCSGRHLTQMTDGDMRRFFLKLEQGQKEYVQLWEKYTSYLAAALNNIHMVLDCDIVIGGYVGGFIEKHMQALYEKVEKRNIFTEEEMFVKPCAYKFEAAALGAALSIIEDFIDQI